MKPRSPAGSEVPGRRSCVLPAGAPGGRDEITGEQVSLTTTITPGALGLTWDERVDNLASILDGYVDAGGFHLNVNVLDRQTLADAMAHPERYPDPTIRVSGYAVTFVRLTTEQQRDVISRTFHGSR